MRSWKQWAMIGGGMLAVFPLLQPALAGTVMPADYSYGEKPVYSNDTRQEYQSRGQEFIRDYVRDELMKVMAANGLEIDNETMAAGVSVDVKKYYADPSYPLDTQVKVYADQDLSHYQNSHFLPVEMEVVSSYDLQKNFKLHAKLTAPWNKEANLEMGSEFLWNSRVSSFMQYRLCSSSQVYDGFDMGLGFKIQDWMVKLNYNLTPDFAYFQHLSLTKNF